MWRELEEEEEEEGPRGGPARWGPPRWGPRRRPAPRNRGEEEQEEEEGPGRRLRRRRTAVAPDDDCVRYLVVGTLAAVLALLVNLVYPLLTRVRT